MGPDNGTIGFFFTCNHLLMPEQTPRPHGCLAQVDSTAVLGLYTLTTRGVQSRSV